MTNWDSHEEYKEGRFTKWDSTQEKKESRVDTHTFIKHVFDKRKEESFLFFLFSFLFLFLCIALNSLCTPDWPWTERFICLCLLSVGIKGMRHHCPNQNEFLNSSYHSKLVKLVLSKIILIIYESRKFKLI